MVPTIRISRSFQRWTFLAVVAISVSSCRIAKPDLPPAERLQVFQDITIKTELFFGLQKPEGDTVSTDEWKDFLNREITPRFGDGLTVIEAYGQYLGAGNRLYREPSRIVILIHQASDSHDAAIDSIRSSYKQRFRQESVLRVSSPVGISF